MKAKATVFFEDSAYISPRKGTSKNELMDSFYNKSLKNLMRIDHPPSEDDTDFPESVGIDDMIHMEQMEEESVLKNLKLRYNNDQIYTFSGGVLVAINPFQTLNIYNEIYVRHFSQQPDSTMPHIFSIAETAYKNMKNFHKDQSILICGESGSGKTESTKLILQYLVDRIASKNECEVETRMLESIPILEALGNAKTSNNDNSSRFGKFIQVEFNKNYSVSGCKIKAYLLEKSRVTHQPPGERNFHIFYQITEGANEAFRRKFHVQRADYYRYLSSSVMHLPHVDEEEAFTHFNIALRLFRIPESMIEQIFNVLVAILYLGNIEFTESIPVKLAATEKASEALMIAAELLGIDTEELLFSLTHNRLCMRLEVIEKPLTREQSYAVTNTLAKCLYHRLFHWIVNIINETTYGGHQTKNFIGILDIFGFENFERNSYEQFLINYANEKFQQLQNHYIFDVEQREYVAEGITWNTIDSSDNQAILSLIETPPLSILSILREGARFPNASPDSFVRKLHKQFGNDPLYEIPPLHADSQFILRHYPGKVTYTTDGWVDKDHDNLPPHIHEIIDSRCTNKLISLIFSSQEETPSQASQNTNTTISFQFKMQLKELMNTIHLTNPLFVRCIKPNVHKEKNQFNDDLIVTQLRCTGMLNCIQIRKLGFPIRYKYEDFLSRYSMLVDHHHRRFGLAKNTPKKVCRRIVDKLRKKLPNDFRHSVEFGKTKILLKTNIATLLDKLRGDVLQSFVLVIQQWWRMIRVRMYFSNKKSSAVILQRSWRGFSCRLHFVRYQRANLLLQTSVRCFLAMRAYKKIQEKKAKEKIAEEERIKLLQKKENGEKERKRHNKLKLTLATSKEPIAPMKDVKQESEEESDIETSSTHIHKKKRKRTPSKLQNRIVDENPLEPIEEIEAPKKRKHKRKSKRLSCERDKVVPKMTENPVQGRSKSSKSLNQIDRRKSKIRLKSRSSIKSKIRYDFQCLDGKAELPIGTKEILIGTSWELKEPIDMDSCCIFYEYGTMLDVVWQFNNISKDRSAQFLGFPKWLPKNQQVDREQIHVNLMKLPPNVSTIFISLIIFSPSITWKSVEHSTVRILCSPKEGVDAEWTEVVNMSTHPNESGDANSAKIFCKLSRNGFKWAITPLDIIVPARTYKTLLPHLENLLDPKPPVRKISVGVHKAENLQSSSRKSFVSKFVVSICFGEEKKSTSPASSASPVWNSLEVIESAGSFLIISVVRKKSGLLRIERKLLGSIHIALTPEPLQVPDTWFELPEGRILLSIFEK